MLISKNNYNHPFKTVITTKKVDFYKAIKENNSLVSSDEIGILYYPVPAEIPESFSKSFRDNLDVYSIFALNNTDRTFYEISNFPLRSMILKYNAITQIMGFLGAQKVELIGTNIKKGERSISFDMGLDKNKNIDNKTEAEKVEKNSKIGASFEYSILENFKKSIQMKCEFNKINPDIEKAKEIARKSNLLGDPVISDFIDSVGLYKSKEIIIDLYSEAKKTISEELKVSLFSNIVKKATEILLGTRGEFYVNFIGKSSEIDEVSVKLKVEF